MHRLNCCSTLLKAVRNFHYVQYGLIARSKNGEAAQVEKVDHSTAVQLLASLGEIESVGASLGSFSISSFMLECLLGEFAAELATKTG